MKAFQNNQIRFEKTCYNKKDISTVSISRKQVEAIDLKSYDFCYALCLDTLGYKNRKGVWKKINEQENGLGPVTWPILQGIQLNPNIALDRKTLIQLTGFNHLGNYGIMPRIIISLRKVFGEMKSSERLIVTPSRNPLTLMWPKKYTWIWIMPIPPQNLTGN